MMAKCLRCGRVLFNDWQEKYCSTDCAYKDRGRVSRTSIRERFTDKYEAGDPDDCWEWQGQRNDQGYGLFSIEGRQNRAHRIAWQLHNSATPGLLFVCHHCDNPACVNPDHLFLGTVADNTQDMYDKGRGMAGEKHYFAKLKTKDIPEIRYRHEEGERSVDIAKVFGVARTTINDVVSGRTWKHVE